MLDADGRAGASELALLAASLFHFHLIDLGELRRYLTARGVEVKPGAGVV